MTNIAQCPFLLYSFLLFLHRKFNSAPSLPSPLHLSRLGGCAPLHPHPASLHVHLVRPLSSGAVHAALQLTISTCVISHVHTPQVHVGPDRQLSFPLLHFLSLSLSLPHACSTLQILNPCSRLINNGLVRQ